jgi:hypothetical protein
VLPLGSQFSFSNYIKVIYTYYDHHSFSTADGSRDQLSLNNGSRTPKEFEMPEPDNVGKVTIHYSSDEIGLWGISVFDRKGNRLFKTNDSKRADREHTVELLPGERWVGVRSHARSGKDAVHYDIQIVIMGKWTDEMMHLPALPRANKQK